MKKELILFFTLSYLVSWAIWLPLYLPFFGVKIFIHIPFNHAIGSWGPLIASLVTTYLFRGKYELIKFIKSIFEIKNIIYFVLVILLPFLISLVAYFVTIVFINSKIEIVNLFTSQEFPQFNLLQIILFNIVFYGLGEEAGWRGFALPKFQEKFGIIKANVALTFFWAIWHIPLFLYRPGLNNLGFAGTIGWFFSLLAGSLIFSFLYNYSKSSVLVCILFHGIIDVSFLISDKYNYISAISGVLITVLGISTIPFLIKPNTFKYGK